MILNQITRNAPNYAVTYADMVRAAQARQEAQANLDLAQQLFDELEHDALADNYMLLGDVINTRNGKQVVSVEIYRHGANNFITYTVHGVVTTASKAIAVKALADNL